MIYPPNPLKPNQRAFVGYVLDSIIPGTQIKNLPGGRVEIRLPVAEETDAAKAFVEYLIQQSGKGVVILAPPNYTE